MSYGSVERQEQHVANFKYSHNVPVELGTHSTYPTRPTI